MSLKTAIWAVMVAIAVAFQTPVRSQVVIQKVKSTVGLQIAAPVIQSFPPLNSGMPLNVMEGYIYYDSICRNASWQSVDSFANQLTYSDTLANALKYLYVMDDYDPVTFSQWLRVTPSITHYKTAPGFLYTQLLGKAASTVPDTLRTAMLSGADYIAHVKITSLQNFADTALPAFQDEVIVSCQVLDTLKGKIYPPCPEMITSREKGMHAASLPDCLQFYYSPSAPRKALTGDVLTGWEPRLKDSLGNPWITADQEYIVFLTIRSLGNDTSNFYMTVHSAKFNSSVSGMYPIVDGVVQDQNDDFGFGANLPLADFIAALRNRIYTLTHP
ncbi:MAG TPA: hypothetical protein VFH95_12445 [Candidatus Kapabacteria bacterium]|nr:hypothetical protein [Candidatus Kapabacteria bacterium]